jgi:hypothetical protein
MCRRRVRSNLLLKPRDLEQVALHLLAQSEELGQFLLQVDLAVAQKGQTQDLVGQTGVHGSHRR